MASLPFACKCSRTRRRFVIRSTWRGFSGRSMMPAMLSLGAQTAGEAVFPCRGTVRRRAATDTSRKKASAFRCEEEVEAIFRKRKPGDLAGFRAARANATAKARAIGAGVDVDISETLNPYLPF